MAILIDTWLGVSDIGEIVKQITSLSILTVLTHAHWDHIGGLDSYSKFAIHEEEKSWISDSFPIPLQVVKNNLVLKPCEFPQTFSVDNYVVFQGSPNRILHDEDEINLGNRTIVVVHTPGHYKMPINPDIIDKIADAFQSISDSHKLSHGNGIFDFGEFQIHI